MTTNEPTTLSDSHREVVAVTNLCVTLSSTVAGSGPTVMVTPESARMVMETYTAADLSAERNEPIDLPLSNAALSAVAEMVGGKR